MKATHGCRGGSCLDCRVGAEVHACVEMLKHCEVGSVRGVLSQALKNLLRLLADNGSVNEGDAQATIEQAQTLRGILKKESKRRKI